MCIVLKGIKLCISSRKIIKKMVEHVVNPIPQKQILNITQFKSIVNLVSIAWFSL
jgi:hypothetical protein